MDLLILGLVKLAFSVTSTVVNIFYNRKKDRSIEEYVIMSDKEKITFGELRDRTEKMMNEVLDG